MHLSFARPPHVSGCSDIEAEIKAAAKGVKVHTAMLDASGITGSHVREMTGLTPGAAAAHFSAVASLLRTLGEAPMPVVAVLDGVVSGSALGVGAQDQGSVRHSLDSATVEQESG